MATYYLDQGAYGAYAAIPTWGVPQDGDGSAPGLSTASATVSIDFTGVSASAGNTFSVLGAVLTCVASGATGSQFNAGSGATLAANIAEAVNRSSANTTAPAAGWNVVQLRTAAYARVTGSSLEIMTRAGSATYNGLTAVAWSGITGLSGSFTWAGGNGGAWGMLLSDVTTGATALPVHTQGILTGNQPAGPRPSGVAGDLIWTRANDYVMGLNNITPTVLADFHLLVDANNEVWSGSLGKTFTIDVIAAASNPVDLRLLASGRYSFRANVPGGLVFRNSATVSVSDYNLSLGFFNTGGTIYYENCTFLNNSVRSQVNPFVHSSGGGEKNFTAYKCLFKTARANNPRSIGGSSTGNAVTIIVDDCDVVLDSMTAAHPGFVSVSNGSYRITNSRYTGAAIMPPFARNMTGASSCMAFAENLAGFQLSAVTLGFSSNHSSPHSSNEQCVAVLQHIGPNKAYRYESNTQLIDWLPDAGYPTLTATMPDGTPWSFRSFWAGGSNAHSFGAISTSVVLTKRSLPTTATRTITVELLLNSVNAASVTNAMLALDVTYTDDTGAVRVQTTRKSNWLFEAGTALASSTASWTLNSYAASHVPRRIQVTTAYPVMGGSDVVAKLVMLAPSPTTGTDIFVEPEMGIA